MPSEHVAALMLPFGVAMVLPSFLLYMFPIHSSFFEPVLQNTTRIILGAIVVFMGMYLLAECIHLFNRIGKGTLAPWSPTQHMVIIGPYRYMRNPMILGVLLILLGESVCFSSLPVLFWFAAAFIINHIYFIKSEEPGLVKRFGDEYEQYKENVPRWIPRRRPWIPLG
jgi:protein-S-isoprenylcysteine O-methyltransferase Ste14